MEVEVKLRLGGAEDHARLGELLRPGFRERLEQENNFFDGARQELSSRRVNLRVRLMGDRAEVTVRGRSVLTGGVARAPEENEAVEPAVAQGWVADPLSLPPAGRPCSAAPASPSGTAPPPSSPTSASGRSTE